jgi:hypothetical protein
MPQIPSGFGQNRGILFFAEDNTRVFGVSSVEGTAHASHRSCDYIAFTKLISWNLFYQANRLNPERSRESHSRRVALPSEHF